MQSIIENDYLDSCPCVEKDFLLVGANAKNLWSECDVISFIHNHTNQAFDIVKEYTTVLQSYKNCEEYISEFGENTFYDEIHHYFAFSSPKLVKKLVSIHLMEYIEKLYMKVIIV